MTTVKIEYEAVENLCKKGYWLPMIWKDGQPMTGTYSEFYMDEETALKEARKEAEREASRYVGNWNIQVSECQ
jgi:hypothetical protein